MFWAESAAMAERRATANQARAVMLAIAGSFGEDVKGTLEKLEE